MIAREIMKPRTIVSRSSGPRNTRIDRRRRHGIGALQPNPPALLGRNTQTWVENPRYACSLRP